MAEERTPFRGNVKHDERESLEFMRGRDADSVVDDEPGGGEGMESIPIENLYSSAGAGDISREGDAPESLTDLPDLPTDPVASDDEKIRQSAQDALVSEFGEGLQIEISVEHRELLLEGQVDSPEIRDEIGMTMEAVVGVERVVNEIRVI